MACRDACERAVPARRQFRAGGLDLARQARGGDRDGIDECGGSGRVLPPPGIYPEQLSVWREACERANDWERAATSRITRETKDDKKRFKELERDLARKEKALAEAAALMLLRKKAEAIWGRGGEDE